MKIISTLSAVLCLIADACFFGKMNANQLLLPQEFSRKGTYGFKVKDVKDISYDKLIEYTRSILSSRPIQDTKELEELRKCLEILSLETEEFEARVIPQKMVYGKNEEVPFFRFDRYQASELTKKHQYELEFAQCLLKAIIDNPVGEARIKSLMLAFYLSQLDDKTLRVDQRVLRDDGSVIFGCQKKGIVLDVKPCKGGEVLEFGTLACDAVDLINDAFDIPTLLVYQSDACKNRFLNHRKQFKNKILKILTSVLNEGIDSAQKKWNIETINECFDIIAVTYIHELSHSYHLLFNFRGDEREAQRLNYDKEVLKYCNPLLNKKVFKRLKKQIVDETKFSNYCSYLYTGDHPGKSYWKFWDLAEEMITILGFGLYCIKEQGEEPKITLIEDRVNENAARYSFNKSTYFDSKIFPYIIGHSFMYYDELYDSNNLKSGWNDEETRELRYRDKVPLDEAISVKGAGGYKFYLDKYFKEREINKEYLINCNEKIKEIRRDLSVIPLPILPESLQRSASSPCLPKV